MNDRLENSVTIELLDASGERSDAIAWSASENSRTRDFLTPGPGNLDDQGKMGKWKNLAFNLSAKRGPDGTITAVWKVTIDLHVQKWRWERSDVIIFVMKVGGAIKHSAVMTGFANSCTNGWVTKSWEGTFPVDLMFTTSCQFGTQGPQYIVRC